MAWLAVNPDGTEYMFSEKPIRITKGYFSKYDYWLAGEHDIRINRPQGSIKKLIGRELSWSDDAVELK